MAPISPKMAKAMLDWTSGEGACHAHRITSIEVNDEANLIRYTLEPIAAPVIPKPDQILDMKVGAAEAVAVGAAVLVGKNPVLSRRFWSRS